MKPIFSPTSRDLEQLAALGIPLDEIHRQLELFRSPPPPVRLVRPCRPGDGLVRLTTSQQDHYEQRWRSQVDRSRFAKFVPASGAATRMFKDLTVPPADAGATSSRGAQRLLESLQNFAFYEALDEALTRGAGLNLESLVAEGQSEPILRALLGPEGLDYATLPKGLILFHRYPTGSRTALEEQLWEGSEYLVNKGDTTRYHFTVTDSHEAEFRAQLARLLPSLESRLNLTLEIDFSNQSPATDTVAVDLEGQLVRHGDGRLLLRPAGHGALLTNLQSLDTDGVFIKNIDNVSHQRLHPVSSRWKRILAGYFAEIQDEIFELQESLETDPAAETVDRALRLLQEKMAVVVPGEILESDGPQRVAYLLDRLDRPLRVCGMVENEGEPGGGPFWLEDPQGGLGGQIVESAQVDPRSEEQQTIWRASTHFNPVDLVCGLTDRNGRRYDLARYVDPATSFVAEKSHAGRAIRALERPGLWNGGMARWNTAFVEVPLQTFTPVKTVFDLLRPEHQA